MPQQQATVADQSGRGNGMTQGHTSQTNDSDARRPGTVV